MCRYRNLDNEQEQVFHYDTFIQSIHATNVSKLEHMKPRRFTNFTNCEILALYALFDKCYIIMLFYPTNIDSNKILATHKVFQR